MALTNSASFDHADLQSVLGRAASDLPRDIKITGVSTDTRTIEPGNAFIALVGENFNGHDFVEQASAKGASLLVVSDDPGTWSLEPGTNVVEVKDTLHALGSFGWYHRRRYDIPVIAIGGASGKTSTKDLTAHILSTATNVLATASNNNNQIGVPKTLLQLTGDHRAAVIEIGTNEPGEIEKLVAMVQPTHGLVTTIGAEHLEKLVDLDGVEKEETVLFDYLSDHGGVSFVNTDDERLRKYGHGGGLGGRVVTFGLHNPADIHPKVDFDSELHPTMSIVKDDFTFRAPMQTIGLASALNATAAMSVAWTLGLGSELVRKGLKTYEPPTSKGYARVRVQKYGVLTVINDSYNANPESMALSLKTLAMYPAKRRIAVLGDMRELGSTTKEEHSRILSQAMSVADIVLLFGPEFSSLIGGVESIFETHEQLANRLKEIGREGDVVLVKGSRGLEMERVLTVLGDQT